MQYTLQFPVIKSLNNHLLLIFSLTTLITIAFYVTLTPPIFLSWILPNIPWPKPCDYSYGRWVWDESLPGRRYSEDCPFLDPGFRCRLNGRQDLDYQKWRWQPRGCNLVVIDRPPANAPKEVKGVIRVDKLHWFSTKWVGADLLVFSAGHCSVVNIEFDLMMNSAYSSPKGHYFQEGEYVNMTMDVMEAFRRSLNTLKEWVTQNLQPRKAHVFLRSYSPVHYRNGTWDEGGYCNTSREPETDYSKMQHDPLTEFRKDGHPSSHREQGIPVHSPQDCSHWCLPGVPDTWNELMYAELLKMGFRSSKVDDGG